MARSLNPAHLPRENLPYAGRADLVGNTPSSAALPQNAAMPSGTAQGCSTEGCTREAAFRTNSRRTWCQPCLEKIFKEAGLRPIDPVKNYSSFGLTECLTCGTQAHYRLIYVLDQNATRTKSCRACYWTSWAEGAREPFLRSGETFEPVDIEHAREFAADNGFEYLRPLTSPSLEDDPHLVKCFRCGKITAERLGDIAFGSSCTQNKKPSKPAGTGRISFKDSCDEAISWWDHARNDENVFATITVKARRKMWWICPECGENFEESVQQMTGGFPKCPVCAERRRLSEEDLLRRYASTRVADVPMLLQAWDDEADPKLVMVAHGGFPLYRFRCPNGHHPRLTVFRYLQAGCPPCRSAETIEARIQAAAVSEMSHQLADRSPEIASQWHPTLNGSLTAKDVVFDSKRIVWWLDPRCGHEWQESVRLRDSYQRYRCPVCRTILDSIGYQMPELAAEWSPSNPLNAWQVRPFGALSFIPEWVCSANSEHRWAATLPVRSNGGDCPECRESGKSRVELAHHAAAIARFGSAKSGGIIRSEAFSNRSSWTADICVELPGEQDLLIEYDGSYWHADKHATDTEKTIDLLAAGYRVVRLREAPLPPLRLEHPQYLEVVVQALAPAPERVMETIARWVSSKSAAPRPY